MGPETPSLSGGGDRRFVVICFRSKNPERVFTRVHSLRERLDSTHATHHNEILMVPSRIESHGKGILKPHQLMLEFEEICKEDQSKLHDGAFHEVLKCTQEAIVLPPLVALAIQSAIAAINCSGVMLGSFPIRRGAHFIDLSDEDLAYVIEEYDQCNEDLKIRAILDDTLRFSWTNDRLYCFQPKDFIMQIDTVEASR
ncbi:hypothetical protein L1987_46296 [Smallanthus sonchifolius]|uniref:Uncharacterized protein n=1 Tax=Smallanthus sonchifolius TaxID=185202 RepID=A0ACB9FZW9_9ASTR|nr:hypothetical protein L1987_46296 [Smallanthus sonchifolius]